MDAVQPGDFGEFTPTEEVLKILQQSADGKSVTVQLNQAWKLTELDWVGAQFDTETGTVCYSEDNVSFGSLKSTFTAKCTEGIAKFDILVRDDCFLPAIGVPLLKGKMEVIEKPMISTCPKPQHMSTDGVTKFPSLPVEIVSYGNSEVTFRIKQVWKAGAVKSISTLFKTGVASAVCPKVEGVTPNKPLVYTSQCTDGFADINLYVQDDQFSSTDDVSNSAPGYCNVDSNDKKGKPVNQPARINVLKLTNISAMLVFS